MRSSDDGGQAPSASDAMVTSMEEIVAMLAGDQDAAREHLDGARPVRRLRAPAAD